ncbi:MAG: hypothetical protein ACRDFC_08795 [Ignavibacteria bacterium]
MKIFYTITILLILLWGCGIFDTRSPEEPETRRSTFIPPSTPDAVITNLTFSILEKNSNNYHKCISLLSFVFIPDAKSQILYGIIFQNWNYNSEKFYMDNLISQTNTNASSNLFLSNKTVRLVSSDSAVAAADYIVVFQHNRNNIPKSSVGNFRLIIQSDENNSFYITRWEDFRKNDTDFTWSELKANFSN